MILKHSLNQIKKFIVYLISLKIRLIEYSLDGVPAIQNIFGKKISIKLCRKYKGLSVSAKKFFEKSQILIFLK